MIALLAAVRAIHFASMMTIFGGSAFEFLLRRGGHSEPPARFRRILFLIAAPLAFVSGIVWFGLIAGQMSGDWRGSIDPGTLQLTALSTRFGQIFVARFIGLAALWVMCVAKRARQLGMSVLAGFLLAALAPISHAAAAVGGDIGVLRTVNDAAHLLTAGFWIGGLIILAMLVSRHWADPAALLGPLGLFSAWGSFVVALLVISGLINAVSILPASAVSLHNGYFSLLSVKVGLALAMVALASVNRWRFAPALRNGGPGGARPLAASIAIELALGMTIIAIVGSLGLMMPH